MTRLVETATTSLDQPTAFACVAEFANIETWDPGVARSVKLTPGATRVGTAYALVLNANGRAMNMTYTVTEFRPNRRIVLEGRGKQIAAVDTIGFEPSGSGTVITYQADLQLTGVAQADAASHQGTLRIHRQSRRRWPAKVARRAGGVARGGPITPGSLVSWRV